MSVLELRGAGLKDGTRPLWDGLDLTLEAGDRLLAFGPAGSGKKSFLKLVAGVLKPSAGEARLGPEAAGLATPVGYVPEEGGLLSNLTLVQNAALPAVYHRKLASRAAQDQARALLARLGAEAHADRRPAMATAAARRMAHFARAILAEPALFVLDSPLDELDVRSGQAVRKVLEETKACSIIGTATPAPYLAWARRFLFLRPGAATLFEDRAALDRSDDPELRLFLEA